MLRDIGIKLFLDRFSLFSGNHGYQCFRSGLDPDSVEIMVISVQIRIRSRFNQVSGSGFRRAKMTRKTRKKLSAGCFLLRAEGFSCSLDSLYGGLGISKLQFLIQKNILFF
jgi:hypothetical protein